MANGADVTCIEPICVSQIQHYSFAKTPLEHVSMKRYDLDWAVAEESKEKNVCAWVLNGIFLAHFGFLLLSSTLFTTLIFLSHHLITLSALHHRENEDQNHQKMISNAALLRKSRETAPLLDPHHRSTKQEQDKKSTGTIIDRCDLLP